MKLVSMVLAAALVSAYVGTTITGAGATFPYPIYAKWAEAYRSVSGVGLNYQSIGSGGGIKQIKAKTVNFGASDKPLSAEDLEQSGLMQFPMVMGGVVPVVNLPGLNTTLRLDSLTLSAIFQGIVTYWDDEWIKALNPTANLPHKPITVVHRSDGSGTTYIFTHYLSQVSATWKQDVGNSTSVQWPTGVGGKGNEGVANYVLRIAGSIGYVEYAYATENSMQYVMLQNREGNFVSPSVEAFQAAASGADWIHTPGFNVMLTNQPGAKSWPITGATFILVYKQQSDAEIAHQVLEFFDWAYRNGDEMALSLHYIPMPDEVVNVVEGAWHKEIKGPDGNSIW